MNALSLSTTPSHTLPLLRGFETSEKLFAEVESVVVKSLKACQVRRVLPFGASTWPL